MTQELHVAPPALRADRFSHLSDYLNAICARYGARIAISTEEEDLSYEELHARASRVAGFLVEARGVAKGDRVGLMLPNVSAFAVTVIGALRAGCIVVNINPQYSARELRHQLVDAGVETLFIASACLETLRQVRADCRLKTVVIVDTADAPAAIPEGDFAWDAVLAAHATHLASSPAPHDVAFLQYTGGTTGMSKGAALTHHNILSNISQFAQITGSLLKEGEERVLTILPLYHVFALMMNFLAVLGFGAMSVLVPSARDTAAILRVWNRHPISVLTGVNTLFNLLLNTPGFEKLEFAPLKLCIGGGAAVVAATSRQWVQATGCPITEGYGLSETSPLLTINPVAPEAHRSGVGPAVPGTQILLRDAAGQEVSDGQPGELCAKGPQVMRGYWNRDDEDASVFTADGYFRTGDVAIRDRDGHLHIVDRMKEMILVSGFNVYPNEIEAVLIEHTGVLEVACVGIPDERSGEAVAAFVVRKDPALDAEALIAHARQHLAAYKVPRSVTFVDALPKSAVGKILRRELRPTSQKNVAS